MRVQRRWWAILFLCAGSLIGCGRSQSEPIPLGLQRVMLYQRLVSIRDESIRSSYIVRERGTVDYQGRQVAAVEFPGGARDYYLRDDSGIRRLATVRGRDGVVSMEDDQHYILKLPASINVHWSLPSEITLIESVFYESGERIRERQVPVTLRYNVEAVDDTVVVPAGTFTNCIRVKATGSAITRVNMGQNFGHIDVVHTDWYAPGVGLVKTERRETSDSPYLKPGSALQELVSIDAG
jgi:hypothetical protein